MTEIKVNLPPIFKPIVKPSRYKVLYGGRGSAKSWTVARVLVLMAYQRPIRVLCARELQNSIKDSVHRIIVDQIIDMGLSSYFDIGQAYIRGVNGSEFSFEGLRHNVTKIKSYEGVDYAWVEEAQVVSKSSWEVLIPTIRKENSEIWLTFNPELEDDETYQRFVISTPPNCIRIEANWQDNPWFPKVLDEERLYLKAKDPDAYLNIWEGRCRQALEGSLYANELRQAQEENRITKVPVDRLRPVDTFWDLGWADCTSIWFVQCIGLELRIVDFLQNSLQPIQWYVSELQKKGYVYGRDFLPHDATAKQLGTGKSIEETLRSLGRNVTIVPKLSVKDGIQAARTIFPSCWFDADRCADGINALRRYRYEMNKETGQFSKEPLHDEYSHAADAFRYFAVGYKPPVVHKSVTSIMGEMRV